MRLRTLVRCSASAAVLALVASPAWAQDTGTPAAGAQDATAAQADDGEDIVVTGFRESLRSAQNVRRNAPQIVDAIVAEDIGKLPDITVSDTAARIPGVQVERSGGEASRVLVRGLPDFTTTYNGREIFTAETRFVALQDFPAGAIGAIEVFKTSTANLVEPGLAGLVNVRSRRPFDFDGFQVAGSVWGLYTKQAKDITPNGNALITNRWDLGDGEIGALLGVSYTRLHYLDSTRSNTDFVAGGGPNGSRFPDIQRITYGEGDRERPSVNGAIQWRPSPGIELYVEGLWQGFRNRVSDREMSVPLWGGSGFSNAVYRGGRPDLLESATVTNPFRPDGFQGGTYNKTDTYQFAIGGSFESGPFKLAADLARTDSTFTGSTASVDYALAGPQTVTFDTDTDRGDNGALFSFANFDPGNPANYIYRGFYEEAQESQGDDWQARLDLSYELGTSGLTMIEAGLRYTDRNAHREFGNRYWNFEGNRRPFSAVPLTYELFDAGFRGADPQPGVTRWMSPTYDSIRANLVALRRFNMAMGGTNFGDNTDVAPTPDPLVTWDANEKSYAAYAQARYAFSLGQVEVDGNVGIRYSKSNIDLSGTRTVSGVRTPTVIPRTFEDWLPSVNARIRFTPQFQARLSFTQTRTRPSFTDLRASATIDPPGACLSQVPIPAGCVRTGNGGNPFLRQLTSDNYDASLEYYFSPTGFASLSLFHRDMNGFIETTTTDAVALTNQPFRFSGPINSGAGKIRGFEAQVSTFLDFGGVPSFLNAFGVQANLTHLDADADFTYNGTTVTRELLGVSKWSYNLAAFYEKGGFMTRLSYNNRSSFLATYQPRDNYYDGDATPAPGSHLYTERAAPVSRLDLSASINVFDNFTIFGDWTNILERPFKSTLTRLDADGTRSTFPRVVRYEESTMSLGLRVRF